MDTHPLYFFAVSFKHQESHHGDRGIITKERNFYTFFSQPGMGKQPADYFQAVSVVSIVYNICKDQMIYGFLFYGFTINYFDQNTA